MKFYMTTLGLFAHKYVQRNNHLHALTRFIGCKHGLVKKYHFVRCGMFGYLELVITNDIFLS